MIPEPSPDTEPEQEPDPDPDPEPAATPGPRPRKERTENAARRRRQIIDATLRSIEKNGLAGTTLATVSREAGLSQGVAVFYFQNKQALLDAALRHLYAEYQATWQAALEAAGTDPVARLAALVRVDFTGDACSPRTLTLWHAFWGEASARPLYAEIAAAYDAEHGSAMRAAVAALTDDAEADRIADVLSAASDGYWTGMHLSQGAYPASEVLASLARLLAAFFPERAGALVRALTGDAP